MTEELPPRLGEATPEPILKEIVRHQDEDVIATTQHVRHKMLEAMVADGIPTGKEQYRLLTLLNDMDNNALTNKKINTDAQISGNNLEAALLANEMLGKFGNTNPYESDAIDGTVNVPQAELPVIEALPGEMSTEVSNQTYNEFVDKHTKSSS